MPKKSSPDDGNDGQAFLQKTKKTKSADGVWARMAQAAHEGVGLNDPFYNSEPEDDYVQPSPEDHWFWRHAAKVGIYRWNNGEEPVQEGYGEGKVIQNGNQQGIAASQAQASAANGAPGIAAEDSEKAGENDSEYEEESWFGRDWRWRSPWP